MKEKVPYLSAEKPAPEGIEAASKPLCCPSCRTALTPHPDRSDIDFCPKEDIYWLSALIESPDCIPTEEKNLWEGDVFLRPTKIFVNKIET